MGAALMGCGTEAPPSGATVTAPMSPPAAAATLEPLVKLALAVEGDRQAGAVVAPTTMTRQTESSPFRFAEIAKEAGIDFVHFSGMTEAKHFPTANGSGVGVFDYDNDGQLDLYFATANAPAAGDRQDGPNRLYRNLGDGTFQDVTESSGLGFAGFCHGIVVGDIDNDGDQDVFLCNYGPNVLYLNNGDGTFRDISKSAGIDRRTGRRAGPSSTTTTTATSTSTSPTTATGSTRRTTSFCGRPREGASGSTARRGRSGRSSTLLYRNNGDATPSPT